MSKQNNTLVFMVVFILGTILGVLGTISSPVEANLSYFWPAETIEATAGILFGFWGAIAATLFPLLSNLLTAEYPSYHVIGLIPSCVIQSFIPLLIKKIMRFDPGELSIKTICSYSIGCVLLPNIIAGSLGCYILYLLDDCSTIDSYFNALYTWLIGNIPCALIFGLFILKTLTPILKSCNLYYEGFF